MGCALGKPDRKKNQNKQDVSLLRRATSFADAKGLVGDVDTESQSWKTTIPFWIPKKCDPVFWKSVPLPEDI